MKIYAEDFCVISNLTKDGLFNLQTINLSVNTVKEGALLQEKLYTDLARIFLLAEGECSRVSAVVSKTPFLHGSVDMFFENERLARYVFTSAPLQEKTEWRIYAPAMEIYLKENSGILKIKRAVLNSVWEEEEWGEKALSCEAKTLSTTAENKITEIIKMII